MADNKSIKHVLRGAFWAVFVLSLLGAAGGCAHGRMHGACADRGVNKTDPVSWTPADGRTKFGFIRNAGISQAREYTIQFGQESPGGAAINSGTYAVLCGVEGGQPTGASFYLTPENSAGDQQPRYPDAPGLTFTRGWSFITFSWPLIWTRNIDAGSIGTTAIGRWEGMDFSLYLVRNGKPSPDHSGPPVPDTESGLWIETGLWGQFTLRVPADREVAKVHFKKAKFGANLAPVTSQMGQWVVESFDLLDENGVIAVTSGGTAQERAFLAEVLNQARSNGIYELPSGLQPGGPEPVPSETF